MWNDTPDIRFTSDIRNAMRWGGLLVQQARQGAGKTTEPITWREFFGSYYRFYDRVAERWKNEDFQLDYPPLRLLIMSIWMRSIANEKGAIPDYSDDLAKPLLTFNTTLEAASAIACFCIVFTWRRRIDPSRPWLGPIIAGVISASLFWFNAAVLINAHVWPQWDTWILAFFLWAIFLAMVNGWFFAGMLLAIGAMMKGQLLIVLPVLIAWPILAGRFWGALRIVLGIVAGAGLVVLPWLIEWNFNWYEIGFEYGQRHYIAMNLGDTYNLASIMGTRYRWTPKSWAWLPDWISGGNWVELRHWTRWVFGSTLAICAISCAVFDRRKNAHLLIALVAPWVLMYAINIQMHERYLVWAAGASAIFVGISAGWGLLHLAITFWAAFPMINSIIGPRANEWRTLSIMCRAFYPGAGWAVLLIGGIVLYFCIVPRKKLTT